MTQEQGTQAQGIEVPENVETDLENLVDAALPFAARLLGEYGEMYPFAAALSLEGELQMLAADMGEDEHPSVEQVLDSLKTGARAQRDQIRAVVFATDVLADGGDAVRLEVEHQDGLAIVAAFPYEKDPEGGLAFGSHSVGQTQPEIWA